MNGAAGWRRPWGLLFGAGLAAATLSACQGRYLLTQAAGQARILSGTESVRAMLDDAAISRDTRAKLKWILYAKDFGRRAGLKGWEAYEQYYDTGGGPVVWALTVCPADSLEAHCWSFPIVGSVPYLGFFNRGTGRDEQEEWREKGYDTSLRPVSAYSTLGWFKDPVYSSMLADDVPDLVNTVLHEMTHATVYFAGDADLSESLATYIGDQACAECLAEGLGPSHPWIAEARGRAADGTVVSEFVEALADKLRAVYKDPSLSREQKLAAKAEALAAAPADWDLRAKGLKTDAYEGLARRKLNNAVICGWLTYVRDISIWEKLAARLGGGYRAVLPVAEEAANSGDPEKYLKDRAEGAAGLSQGKDGR